MNCIKFELLLLFENFAQFTVRIELKMKIEDLLNNIKNKIRII